MMGRLLRKPLGLIGQIGLSFTVASSAAWVTYCTLRVTEVDNRLAHAINAAAVVLLSALLVITGLVTEGPNARGWYLLLRVLALWGVESRARSIILLVACALVDFTMYIVGPKAIKSYGILCDSALSVELLSGGDRIVSWQCENDEKNLWLLGDSIGLSARCGYKGGYLEASLSPQRIVCAFCRSGSVTNNGCEEEEPKPLPSLTPIPFTAPFTSGSISTLPIPPKRPLTPRRTRCEAEEVALRRATTNFKTLSKNLSCVQNGVIGAQLETCKSAQAAYEAAQSVHQTCVKR